MPHPNEHSVMRYRWPAAVAHLRAAARQPGRDHSAPSRSSCRTAGAARDQRQVHAVLGNADPAPDWSDLYKIHEILLDNVPGFYQRGWVTKDQISTFTASANRKEVSGDLARHARLKGDPPKRTMTLVEARQLIGSVVTAWLDWLRSSSNL